MLERGFLEGMTGACRIKQIAGKHRIELEPCEVDAVLRQDDDVELQVVTELVNRRILEQRTQALERRLPVELLRCARTGQQIGTAVFGLMPDRHVARLAVTGGECKSDDAGAHRGRFAWND